MTALNPKVSLLIKLAKLADLASQRPMPIDQEGFAALIEYPEVIEWLDRMAELRFIRQPYMPEPKPTEETL